MKAALFGIIQILNFKEQEIEKLRFEFPACLYDNRDNSNLRGKFKRSLCATYFKIQRDSSEIYERKDFLNLF